MSVPKHKIYPDSNLICTFDKDGRAVKTQKYKEVVFVDRQETKNKGRYNVTLYFDHRPFVRVYPDSWVMDSEGNPRTLKPTDDPFELNK